MLSKSDPELLTQKRDAQPKVAGFPCKDGGKGFAKMVY